MPPPLDVPTPTVVIDAVVLGHMTGSMAPVGLPCFQCDAE